MVRTDQKIRIRRARGINDWRRAGRHISCGFVLRNGRRRNL